MNINLQIFAGLPFEIIKIFMNYDGRLKYRNGKWMNQIDKNDKRLLLYDTIPKPYLRKDEYTLPGRHDGDFHIAITFTKKKRLKQLYIYNQWIEVPLDEDDDDDNFLKYRDNVYRELNILYNDNYLHVKKKEIICYLFRRFGDYNVPDDKWNRE